MFIESEANKPKGFKHFTNLLKKNWMLFGGCMVGFVALGYLYNTYSTQQYLINGTVLVESRPVPAEPSSIYSGGMSSVLNNEGNVKNEGDVLRTRQLLKETVNHLHLNVRTLAGSGFTATELYDEAPFIVKIKNYRVDSLQKRDYIVQVLSDKKVHLTNSDEKIDKEITYGQVVKLPQYDLVVEKKPVGNFTPAVYTSEIVSEDDATSDLLKNYDAEFSDKNTSVVDITLYYPNSKRGETIIQHLMQQYLDDNETVKKNVIDSMLTFINGRIALVTNELNNIEKNYQNYRANNKIADIDEQSRVLVGNANNNSNQLQNQEIQLSIMKSLEDYLKDPANNQVVPSSLIIQDASFSDALNGYNDLVLMRQRKLLSYTESSVVIGNIDEQLKTSRANLIKNIESYRKEMELRNSHLGNQGLAINKSLKSMPQTQRAMLDFNRQQDLKQQLYMYLLQKREETALAKRSDLPVSRIIDPAKSSKGPAKPLKPVIYLLSALLGFIVPFGYVSTRSAKPELIKSEQDIENETDVSIIGKIGHVDTRKGVLLEDGLNDHIDESFRTLRTKIQNILTVDGCKTVMLTSSINGEGKTFISAHIANMLAKTGKKVMLMELDLRRPQLSGFFGHDNKVAGFADYINGVQDLNSVIKSVDVNSNLFLLSSGVVSSNASELLLNNHTKGLFEELKSMFDYIIIDSSPVGLVSDSLIIEKYADMTIYVCRHNYTTTEQIGLVNQLKTKDNVDNIYLVINDVDFSKSRYLSYGYGVSEPPAKKGWKA